MLNPDNQLTNLRQQTSSVIGEPSSLIDQIPYIYQNILDSIQTSSGLPWWGILVGVGMVGRLATLPAHVQLEKNMMTKIPLIRLEKEGLIAKLSGDLVLAIKKFKEADALRKGEGISSSVRLFSYLIPGGIVFALNLSCVYGLTSMNYAPLLDTSFLWMHSLCLSDPHRILSFANGIMVAAVAKRYVCSIPDSEKSKMITAHKKKWILFTFGAIAAQAALPASVLLYWSVSNATRLLLIDTLLCSDPFRTQVGLVAYAAKLKAFGTLPMVDTTPKAVQLADNTHTDAVAVDEGSIRENELAKLWKEGDLEVLKTAIEEQKNQQIDASTSLEEDLKYCEEELQNMSFTDKFKNPISMQLVAQQKIIQDKIAAAEKSRSHLDAMERKVSIAERKQKFQYLLTSEEEGQYGILKQDLLDAHINLLDDLEECEVELGEVHSRNLQHYERYIERQKLLKLQQSLLDDIEFCEKEILDLPNLKSDAETSS